MNGAEQRARHTALAALQTQLDDAGVVVEALDVQLAQVAKTLLEQLEVEREARRAGDAAETAHRNTLAEQQRRYVDDADRALARRLDRIDARTLWQRLRWLVRG